MCLADGGEAPLATDAEKERGRHQSRRRRGRLLSDKLGFADLLRDLWAWLRGRRPTLAEQIRERRAIERLAEAESESSKLD
jgi:hypothetical protein